MAYNELHANLFKALQYQCDAGGGGEGYNWLGNTPSAEIISAVSALPTTEVALYDLVITEDSD